MNNRRSFIVGIKSTILLSKEKKFLKKYKPWGVILFARNIKNIDFIQEDAQTFNLSNFNYDAIFSRFGIMFFEDPFFATILSATSF